MRPDTVTPVNVAHYFAFSKIDHYHVGPVGAGLANARIAIDRDIGGAAVGEAITSCPVMPPSGTVAICRSAFGSIMPSVCSALFATRRKAASECVSRERASDLGIITPKDRAIIEASFRGDIIPAPGVVRLPANTVS